LSSPGLHNNDNDDDDDDDDDDHNGGGDDVFCRPLSNDVQKTLVEPLRGIFSCNLHLMDIQMFVDGFITAQWAENTSIPLRSFRNCVDPRRRLETLPRCLVPLIEKCRRSEVVAVKVIRFHMGYVDKLLSDDPDLRLIHVVRDPRGLLESWRKFFDERSGRRTPMMDMRLNAKIMCRRMLTDCHVRRRLELKYPGRILLVRYEDLVTDTDTVIGDIYNGLLQLAVPSNIVDGTKNQLHATADNGATGTLRANGTATAGNWRRTIKEELYAYMKDTCGALIAELHYQL